MATSEVDALSPQQKQDLYNQVGDAMYSPGFSLSAHITGNTVNGVFVPPVNNPPSATAPVTNAPVPVAGASGSSSSSSASSAGTSTTAVNVSTIAGLSQSELTALYQQVGDAMYAPGFNYAAHIAGNTVNGVFTAPVYIPANTSTVLTMPAVGTAAYQKLLAETGGASANAGFNYAAHVAATVSQSRADLSYDDVMRIIVETGKTDFGNFDLAAYRTTTGSKVGLGNEFANSTVAQVASSQIQQAVSLSLPTPGSAEHKALSVETGGASELPGFNYLAHVAAITSQKVLTSLSYAEVVTLIAETGKTDFKNFDLVSYQKEKVTTDLLLNRFVADPAKSNPSTPAIGSLEYQAILKDTGLKDLSGFDYAAYLVAKKDAQLAITTLQGTVSDDVIIAAANDTKHIYVAGAGNDKVTATTAADILIGGAGSDTLDGGAGTDKAVFSGALANYKIDIAANQLVIADSQSSRDGVDTLKNVERLSFSDVSLALDINGVAGESYRLYKAAFDREPDKVGVGFWIKALDDGAGTVASAAQGFIASQEFEKLYGANSSSETFIAKLYQNVLHRTPDAEGYAFWLAAIHSAGRAQVLVNFSDSVENVNQVAPLVATGIQYTEFIAQ